MDKAPSVSRLRRVLLSAALLAPLIAAMPAPAAAQVYGAKTFTLAHGMQVVLIESHRAPVVAHMVWYRVGAADEVQGLSGIAHFLEHLMFKGTPSVPQGQFSRIVAREGGQDNAFTSWDYTGYFQTVARDRLELVMRMEADRMTNLVLRSEDIEPERLVILEERRQRIDNEPRALLREQMLAALWLNHPYGRPIIGWEHEIRAIPKAELEAFYRRWYAPNNAILVVQGDIALPELRSLAERYYGVIPTRPVPERMRPQDPPGNAERRVVRRDSRVREPSFMRIYAAPSLMRGERAHVYPLEVLAHVLGSGLESRLSRALVQEQGIAVSAGASYDSESLDLGSFYLFAQPRPGVAPERLEAAMDAVLARMLAEGVTEEELARSLRQMTTGAAFARDSLMGAARTVGAALAVGIPLDEVEYWPDRLRAVTAPQVAAAARATLRTEASVSGWVLPQEARQ
ncbi:MAG: insulinase family protein [Alphaproteobacteria bacterium]|nr:insulinase family protein [Alphaproteobacteria bacterium]